MKLPNELIGRPVKIWITGFSFAPRVKILDIKDGIVDLLYRDGSIVHVDQNAIYGW